MPDVSRSPRTEARSLSLVRHGAGARTPRRSQTHGVHMPDASGNYPDGTGIVPNRRHGVRAAYGNCWRRGESRTSRHEPAVLEQPRPHRAAACDSHGFHAMGDAVPANPERSNLAVAGIRARHSGSSVGRLAFLPALLDISR